MVAPCGEGPVLPGGGIHSEIAGGRAKLELFPLPLNPLTRTALLPWFVGPSLALWGGGRGEAATVRNLLDEGVDLNSLFPSLRGCCSNQTQRCNEFAWPLPAPPEACSHRPPLPHTSTEMRHPTLPGPRCRGFEQGPVWEGDSLQPCPRIPSLSPSPVGNP